MSVEERSERLDSAPPAPPREPPGLTPVELGRWAWRQLTSMRTALVLLFLLALAAVPGSVVPQEAVDSLRAAQWKERHPQLTPIYERLGLFGVYHSVWFSAIYLLLVVSLVGCIVPRSRVYARAMRARPPRAPRNLGRLPEHRTLVTDLAPDAVLDRARSALPRHRVVVSGHELSAEKGQLREAGNLLFHLSVLVVLAGVAIGSLFGFKGGVIVVTGNGFANSLSQYDDFSPGGLFRPDDLAPFSFTVDDFKVRFIRQGREAGMAHEFSAALTYRAAPTSARRHTRISVNHPLHVDGTDVYLISHGYAPHLTVRDGRGHVAYAGPVVFLPEDATFRSFGVVKVPDAVRSDGRRDQLGFEGEFYPTYAFTDATGPFSAFPDAKNPALSMLVYHGDLGLDGGTPQSVYALAKKGLSPLTKPDGKPLRVDLTLGRTVRLPHGEGSITFDGLSRFVKLQISRSPADWLALLGMSLGLVGLLGSLFIRPRRIWVRARAEAGRTLVEVAGLDRSSGGDLAGHVDALAERLGAGVTKED
jgi:cytochrome c biogenesis protein